MGLHEAEKADMRIAALKLKRFIEVLKGGGMFP